MAENEKTKVEAVRVEDSATGMITETASGDRAIAAVAAAERSLIEAAVRPLFLQRWIRMPGDFLIFFIAPIEHPCRFSNQLSGFPPKNKFHRRVRKNDMAFL